MDLMPAQTTVIAVCANAVKSVDSSKEVAAPRCTPPMPPVANTRMPARRARTAVADTVVPASARRDTRTGRSRVLALATPWAVPRCSISSSARPTVGTPLTTPTLAGTTPCRRRSAWRPRAVSTFVGWGSPWVTMAVSRATTGRADATAAATSSLTRHAVTVMRGTCGPTVHPARASSPCRYSRLHVRCALGLRGADLPDDPGDHNDRRDVGHHEQEV